MYKLIRALEDVDEYTRREVDRAIERKPDEVAKIRGQIAKDLRRLGIELDILDSIIDGLEREVKRNAHRTAD